jgi:anti-anti-sigma factor
MAETFQLTHRLEGDVVVLSFVGYLDRFGAQDLKTFFDHQLQAGKRKFVFDFSRLELLNSQGLAALLETAGRVVEEHDGSMAAFGCDKQTQAVLEMSSFFYLATETDNLEQAIASL